MFARLRIFRILLMSSLRDFFALYSLRIYLIAWLPRIIAQIAFFGLLANYAGGAVSGQYALVGNAVHLLAVTSTVFVAASVTWERRAGTLPLLIAAPISPLVVLSARNFGMALHGYLTGAIGILIILPFLDQPIGAGAAAVILLLLLTISFSCYSVGLIVGAIALRLRGFHNLFANLIALLLLCVAGVNYPVSILPEWAQYLGQTLPLTNGLTAIRMLIIGGDASSILARAALEVILGGGYLLVAQFLFYRLLRQARVSGMLELY